MLTDEFLNERFLEYLDQHIELGDKEIERLKDNPEKKDLAQAFRNEIVLNKAFYQNECQGNILTAFNQLSNDGLLELITTTATHAYLPVYKDYPIAVNAQIETGVLEHSRNFDKMSDGFWLPECGYYNGLEDLLKRHNISWVILASQSLILSADEPERGSYSPIRCPN